MSVNFCIASMVILVAAICMLARKIIIAEKNFRHRYALLQDSERLFRAYFVLQIQNMGIQHRAEEHLKHLAYHDLLTGLDNRSEIEKNIEEALLAARTNHTSFAVIMLDLDHFKEVNDQYGHDVGDALLKEVARRLTASVRRSDKVGRLGGDEFIIVLMNISQIEIISIIAKKILKTMALPMQLNEIALRVTTSIGISIYPDDGLSMGTLMKHADVALYCAKEFGKNNHQFFGGMTVQR